MTMEVFTLANAAGLEVRFIAYGGTIMSIRAPDRHGVLADVTPGYDTPEEYEHDGRYLGALVGRFANRIEGARFRIDDAEYRLDKNDGENHLHGGRRGFHNRRWRVAPFEAAGSVGAVLCCRSDAGDGGYPGRLLTRVTYRLNDDNAFTIDFSAITDAPTPVNLTQHAYFNLAGHASGDILNHELFLNADAFTPVGADLIPTGESRGVKGTPFDFTTPLRIGEVIDSDDPQIAIADGFDHNFVLRAERVPGDGLRSAASLYEPTSGRVLEVLTTQPGVQFYSGNGLHDGPPGKGGHRYARRGALALETQHFPDSPNQPQFPSTVLRPGDEFQSRTIWRFSTRPRA